MAVAVEQQLPEVSKIQQVPEVSDQSEGTPEYIEHIILPGPYKGFHTVTQPFTVRYKLNELVELTFEYPEVNLMTDLKNKMGDVVGKVERSFTKKVVVKERTLDEADTMMVRELGGDLDNAYFYGRHPHSLPLNDVIIKSLSPFLRRTNQT